MKLVGIQGEVAGRSFPLGTVPITVGRGGGNDVVLTTPLASRAHARLWWEYGSWTIADCGSSNGTAVNGQRVQGTRRLQPGDEITVGNAVLRFEAAEDAVDVDPPTMLTPRGIDAPPVLSVTVAGGGPVGLSLALMLDDLMGERVAVSVYEGRWTRRNGRVVWKTKAEGNIRRMQVVTIQSRQWTKLPADVQQRLFGGTDHSHMWPAGPDSVDDLPPRNIRIAYVEDQLLELANERKRITLVPEPFDAEAAHDDLAGRHVLAICEGGRSRTREHFTSSSARPTAAMYSSTGEHCPGRGARPAGEVRPAGPHGGAAHRGPEPVPAELAARRGLPQHAPHRRRRRRRRSGSTRSGRSSASASRPSPA